MCSLRRKSVSKFCSNSSVTITEIREQYIMTYVAMIAIAAKQLTKPFVSGLARSIYT